MYKVLVIDDEDPAREAIKILGEWDRLEFGEILEACDGKQGIQILEESKPDIVIVDMKMPELNGVEFLKQAEKANAETLYIVISGYEDFEYTRQAVKSKAVDYLLKPVNKTELNNALTKAIAIIDEKRRQHSEMISRNITLNVSLQILKEKYFLSAVEGRLSLKAYEEFIRIVGTDIHKKSYAVAVLRVMNLQDVNARYFNHDLVLMNFALTNVINEICNKTAECLSLRDPKSEDTIIINLQFEGYQSHEIRQLSSDLMLRAIRKLESLFGIVAAVGVGGYCSDFVLLHESYQSAQKHLESINLMDMRERMVSEPIHKQGGKASSVLGIKKLMEDAFEGGSLEYAQSVVGEYFQKVIASGYFSLGDAKRTMNDMLLILQDMAIEKGISEEAAGVCEEGLKSKGTANDYTRFEEFKNILNDIIQYFYLKIKQQIKSSEGFNIQEIKDHIDKNYSAEIKISFFTEKYFLSREYLMKLFKKEYGCGIYEYVLKIRMEKAKELLRDPKIKVQSIAQMLGYSDNNYFSKAFKNYYGVSPTDYRTEAIKL